MKQLERLLLFQGNRCFFCDQPIPDGEASIEHLVATANGGANDDDNCVVCCKALNAALGNRGVKEKLRAILSHRPQFQCPWPTGVAAVLPTTPVAIERAKLDAVLDDLRRRRTSRPRTVTTLRNTISATFQNRISEAEIDVLFSQLVEEGHITVDAEKVSYRARAKGESATPTSTEPPPSDVES